jgi:hypothetical protein
LVKGLLLRSGWWWSECKEEMSADGQLVMQLTIDEFASEIALVIQSLRSGLYDLRLYDLDGNEKTSAPFTKQVMNKFLAMAFMLCSIHLNAQTWQRLIDNPFNFGGAEAYGIRVIDDTIFVSSVFVVGDTTSDNRAVISKHSLDDGSLIDYEQYYDPEFQNSMFNELNTGYNQLYDTEDTLIYLSSTPFYDNNTFPTADTKLLKINRNLAVVEEFIVDPFDEDMLHNMNGTRIDSEGNILLFGFRSSTEAYAVSDSANSWLVKMTPEGEQLFSKRYDDTYMINYLTPLSDGDYIINCNWLPMTVQNLKRVIKVDQMGNEKWRMTFGGTYSSGKSVMLDLMMATSF